MLRAKADVVDVILPLVIEAKRFAAGLGDGFVDPHSACGGRLNRRGVADATTKSPAGARQENLSASARQIILWRQQLNGDLPFLADIANHIERKGTDVVQYFGSAIPADQIS